jgi:RNA polymerase sigma-70 factor (ECF subfamily)
MAVVTEEDDLLAAALKLDARALGAIHDRYYPDVYRYLFFKVGDSQAAEDLSSEVFMRLLDALHTNRPPQSLRGWLFGVANHLSADYFRQRTRRPQTELSDEMSDGLEGVDTKVMESLTNQSVRQALQQLTEEQQQVLALRFHEGRSVADTASALHKSETAVKQLQFRAVATLRRFLEGLNG